MRRGYTSLLPMSRMLDASIDNVSFVVDEPNAKQTAGCGPWSSPRPDTKDQEWRGHFWFSMLSRKLWYYL